MKLHIVLIILMLNMGCAFNEMNAMASGLHEFSVNTVFKGENQTHLLIMSTINSKPMHGYFILTRPPKDIIRKAIKPAHLTILYETMVETSKRLKTPQEMLLMLANRGYPEEKDLQ